MDKKLEFLFYLAAVACFVLAALQDSGRLSGRGALIRVGPGSHRAGAGLVPSHVEHRSAAF